MGWTTGRIAINPREGLLPGAILALSPNGYWKLNEGGGTVAFDSSGLDRHGAYQAGVSLFDQPGPYGSYPDFAQSGSGVIVPDDADWTPSPGGLTVVGLYQHGDAGGPATSTLDMARKTNEWTASISNIGSAIASTTNTITLPYRLRELTGVPQQVWALFIATLPVGTDPGIWIDGTAGGTAASPSGTQQGNTSSALQIGRTVATDSQPRSLAHVAVFKKLLTTLERDSIVDAAIADGWI